MRFTLPSLLALTSSVSALGNALVQNNLNTTIYLWSVGSSVGDRYDVAPGTTFTQPLHHDPVSGGIAIKLFTTPSGLYTGAPQQILAYSLDTEKGLVWYSLDAAFGEPFKGHRVEVRSGSGKGIVWGDGTRPEGGMGGMGGTEVAGSEGDVELEIGG